MYDRWSLEVFYSGIDDPKLQADMALLERLNGEYSDAVSAAEGGLTKSSLRKIIELKEQRLDVTNRLFVYFRLRRSADSGDKEGNPFRMRIQKLTTENKSDDVRFCRLLGKVDDLESFIRGDALLEEYTYYLSNLKKSVDHSMGEEAETLFARMSLSGGNAWSEQYTYLMSHTEAEVFGEKKTMNALLSMAKSTDARVRKAVYDAQLATYPRIADALAFSVNSIKAQVLTEAEARGYQSPLDMTLADAHVKKETIDAMWRAVKESFPAYREFLKRKAKLLGYENGLPWFEFCAPIVKSVGKKYTPEGAHRHLMECFGGFSDDMAEVMDRAFKEDWIDFYPRQGKTGGAFCYNLTWFGEARILTNYNDDFSGVNTLAHELGHAFHGQQTKKNRPLNRINPLPMAETASTFNEVFLLNDAISKAEGEEKLGLIDKQLTDSIFILPDMYIRFKTEDEMINRRKNGFLYADELNRLIVDTQKEVYGDAIDSKYTYPYLWCDKNHYYSAGRSYYNYPYTFGALFARGLYTKYLEEGNTFVEKYRTMLQSTPLMSVEDAAAVAGIDITDSDFWRRSLQIVYDGIELFKELTENR